eukprot:XP_011664188.1 PREDICTED: sterol regulatory element-binding protein 1 isoform X2 [Strongylocentrotus purpuratus]
MGDQSHWLFSPDSVMNSDPHLNSVKKEEDEDAFLDDLDLQDEDMSFSDLSFNMNMTEYSDVSEERLLGMSEEELTGMFGNQDMPQLVQPQAQQTLQLKVLQQQQQQQAQQLLQAQQQQQLLQQQQQQQQQTLQQVPDLHIVQQEQPQQVIVAPKSMETVNTGSVNVSSELTNLVALLLNNQQQQQQTTVNTVATPAPAQVSVPQLVSAPVTVASAATTVRPATASEVIQQLVQKEQQKQMQNKTIAQLALILQLQQQQQQQQVQQQQVQQQPLLMSTLQATAQPQITTQLQTQKVTTVQQQQQPVQQKVIPLSVQKTNLPRVQVIKQETSKPVVTTVPQLVIQSSQNGNVAIVGSTMATVSSAMVKSPVSTTTTSSMSKIAIPPLSSSPNGVGMHMGKKPEKRKSHNAIEQRYRKSINGRIEDLKIMLFKENKKVSKSHTLQKCIDHLVGLRKMCQTLKQENLGLKAELDKYKGTTTVPDVKDPMTPPSSFTGSPDRCYELGSEPDSPYSGPDSCPDSPLDDDMEMSAPPSPVRTNAGLSGGLLDRTRLVLCVFMFSILAFNPFGFLINKGFESFMVGSGTGFSGDSETMSAGGRKLMGEVGGEGGMETTVLSLIWQVIPTLLVWLMNGTIIATVLVTMLYGDKTGKSSSINVTAYWRYRTQAEQEIMKGNIAQALNQLFHCFAALGRNHPLGNLEYYASFFWNLFCLPLNVFFKGRGIGAWLSRPKGDKQKDGKYPVAQTTARDIAKTYHHIVQLFLTANFSLGVPRAFYMGICSINHAERARDAMSPTERAEIYATVGVLIRTRFSKSLQWLASLVFYRVRYILNRSKSPTPPILSWTLAAFSHYFRQNDIVPTSWQGPSYFTSITEKRNPLVVVSQHLREHMIHNVLKGILTLRPDDNQDSQKSKRSVDQDFMMQLNGLSISLDEASTFYQQNMDVTSNFQARNEYDPVALWWVNLLFVAAYWQIGEEEKAEAYISCIDSLPAELQKESFPLAALQACKARLALLSAAQNDIPDDCLRMSDLASNNLVRSMEAGYSGENSIMLVQLLVVDWLLSTRSAVWQRRQQGSPSTVPATKNELSAFHQDLTTLRKLASELPHVGSKVTLYEAVGRLMAGANPVRTQVLLDRNLRKRNADPKQKDSEIESSTAEHDRAQSLLVKSCYLYSTMPSDTLERKNLLNDAVRSLEKVGDRRGMQSCQQMLQSLQKSGSTQSTNTTVTTACC